MRATASLALGVGAYGMVYGMLATQKGLSLLDCMLMSGVVFAGASQFVVLDLWSHTLPVWTMILTVFVVNLRHVLMGASLRGWLAGVSPAKAYGSLFFMVDESWALSVGDFSRGGRNAAFLLGSGSLLYFAWNLSTVLGATAVSALHDPARWGLDFAFVAAFLVLLVGMFRGREDILPLTVAAAIALLGEHFLPGKWYILLGGLAGGTVEALRHAD